MSATATPPQQKASPPTEAPSPTYAWIAVVLSGLAGLGGLYLSFAEGKYPCPLCFYQRAFAFAVFGLMLIGLLTTINEKVSVATIALPVAFAGLGVALWHINLEKQGSLTCPTGMFGISTAPTQSAVLFGLLCAVLIIDAYQPGRLGNAVPHVFGGAILGAVIALALCDPWGMWKANAQPDRPIPAAEYEPEYPKICLPMKKEE
jgi:disulfide bond formation protein DsbB